MSNKTMIIQDSGEVEGFDHVNVSHGELPITCSDDELVTHIRNIHGDLDDDGWGKDWLGRSNKFWWNCVSVVRGKSTALIEWRSARGILSISTIIWD